MSKFIEQIQQLDSQITINAKLSACFQALFAYNFKPQIAKYTAFQQCVRDYLEQFGKDLIPNFSCFIRYILCVIERLTDDEYSRDQLFYNVLVVILLQKKMLEKFIRCYQVFVTQRQCYANDSVWSSPQFVDNTAAIFRIQDGISLHGDYRMLFQ